MRFIRILHGGSQPTLVEASDGNLYVLKFLDNLQGPHLLLNESMGTQLYQSCKLSIAPSTPLIVTGAFVDQNPSCWIETPEGTRRPSAGLCFGSRFQTAATSRLFEILPGNYHSRLRNREHFWLAWLLDACCAHGDNRQAIFQEKPSGQLEIKFIDFGHMFFGPKGDLTPQITTCRYLDGRVYPRITDPLLIKIRKMADNLNHDELWQRLSEIPDEWKNACAVQNFATCLNRLSDSHFVEMTLDMMVETHRQQECDFSFSKVVERRSLPVLRPCV